MARNRQRCRLKVEVGYRIDGTIAYDIYTARRAHFTSPEHRPRHVVVTFVDGYDADGPVVDVLYTDAAKVVRRPVGKRGKR